MTADGAVKDKTECAPHNGYFFVPTFEQVTKAVKGDLTHGGAVKSNSMMFEPTIL